MKNIRAVLVDDEENSNIVMNMLLREHCEFVDVVDCCTSANEAINSIQLHKPDLVFLDVEMSGKSGFDILKAFDEPDFKVIFATAYNQYAIQAIKFSALDYLLKPIDGIELYNAVEKLVAKQSFSKDSRLTHLNEFGNGTQISKIIIPSKRGFKSIDLEDIVSIEARPGNYAVFYLNDSKEIVATKTLSYYDDMLPSTHFLRIHRSHIVNLRSVKDYNSSTGMITMNQGDKYKVAERRRSKFLKNYRELYSS